MKRQMALRGCKPVTARVNHTFYEYCFQVAANRIGYQSLSLPQLKALQEMITMVVIAGFPVASMKTPITRNDLLASVLLAGAVSLIFSEPRR